MQETMFTFMFLVVLELFGNLDALVMTASQAVGEKANSIINTSWLAGIVVRIVGSYCFVWLTQYHFSLIGHDIVIATVVIYLWLLKTAIKIFSDSQESEEEKEAVSLQERILGLVFLQIALAGENIGAGFAITHDPLLLAVSAVVSILILWPLTTTIKDTVQENEDWLNPGLACFIGLIGLSGLIGLWYEFEVSELTQASFAFSSLGLSYLKFKK